MTVRTVAFSWGMPFERCKLCAAATRSNVDLIWGGTFIEADSRHFVGSFAASLRLSTVWITSACHRVWRGGLVLARSALQTALTFRNGARADSEDGHLHISPGDDKG